jgi:cell division protein FtsB
MQRLLSNPGALCSRWMARLVMALGVAGVLAYLPYRLLDGPDTRHYNTMQSELHRTHESIRQLRADNRGLRYEIDALKRDSRAIENIARNDLGMVFPGELILRIEDGREGSK